MKTVGGLTIDESALKLSDNKKKDLSNFFDELDKKIALEKTLYYHEFGTIYYYIDQYFNSMKIYIPNLTKLFLLADIPVLNYLHRIPKYFAQRTGNEGGYIKEIDLPEIVGVIGRRAFYGQLSIKKVILPVKLSNIQPDAFSFNLAEYGATKDGFADVDIIYKGTKAQWGKVKITMHSFGRFEYSRTKRGVIIKCTDGEVKLNFQNENW